MGATLARHGLSLDDTMLDDPQRHLLSGARARGGNRAAQALRRLDEVLNDLDRTLAALAHGAEKPQPAAQPR